MTETLSTWCKNTNNYSTTPTTFSPNGKVTKHITSRDKKWRFVNRLFYFGVFSSHSSIFHSFEDVAITGEGYKCWPIHGTHGHWAVRVLLMCHTSCDTCWPFTQEKCPRVKHMFNTCLTYKKSTHVKHIKRAHVLKICIKHT